jgi:hypothetical protein
MNPLSRVLIPFVTGVGNSANSRFEKRVSSLTVEGVFDSLANKGGPASGTRYLVNPFD